MSQESHVCIYCLSCNKERATELPWVTVCGAQAERIGMIFRQLLHGHYAMPQAIGHQSLATEDFFIPVTLGHVFLFINKIQQAATVCGYLFTAK